MRYSNVSFSRACRHSTWAGASVATRSSMPVTGLARIAPVGTKATDQEAPSTT